MMKSRTGVLLLSAALATVLFVKAAGASALPETPPLSRTSGTESDSSSGPAAVESDENSDNTESAESNTNNESNEEAEEPGLPLTLDLIRAVSYEDVSAGTCQADCIGYVAYQGLLEGIDEGHFAPDSFVSLAAALTALQRMSGEDAPPYAGPYTDVAPGSWYADAVSWAVSSGIVDGKGETLSPLESISRERLATLLYRFAASGEDGTVENLDGWADGASVAGYARQPMAWALERRIFSAIVSDSIHPKLPVSRAQFAQILVALSACQDDEPVAEALTTQMSAKIAVSASQAHHDEIQLLIDSAASKYGAVGMQVAVVEDGQLTDTYTYGWAQQGSVAMTEDHKIRSASISKVAIGIAAMLLREQGVIDLDADISPYWGVSVRNPYYPDTPITIRSLLSHTSSIRAFDGVSRRRNAVKAQLSQSSGYSNMAPGAISSWNYNNYAFGVLGMTLELASGKYLDTILDESLWSVMEIDAAFEGGCVSRTDLIATLYQNGGVSRSAKTQASYRRPDQPGGSGSFFPGGLTISAKDLGKMTALLASDGYYEGLRLLSSESVELMETRDEHQLGDGTYQALPLRSQDNLYGRDRLYYHTGSAYGVYNLMSYDPVSSDGVVVLTVGASGARDNRGIYAVCGDVSSAIYEIIK